MPKYGEGRSSASKARKAACSAPLPPANHLATLNIPSYGRHSRKRPDEDVNRPLPELARWPSAPSALATQPLRPAWERPGSADDAPAQFRLRQAGDGSSAPGSPEPAVDGPPLPHGLRQRPAPFPSQCRPVRLRLRPCLPDASTIAFAVLGSCSLGGLHAANQRQLWRQLQRYPRR